MGTEWTAEHRKAFDALLNDGLKVKAERAAANECGAAQHDKLMTKEQHAEIVSFFDRRERYRQENGSEGQEPASTLSARER